MLQIDPQFRRMGQGARRRRRRLGALRGLAAALVAAGVLGLAWQQTGPWSLPAWAPFAGGGTQDGEEGNDLARQIVQTESEFEIAPVVRGDTFTDIAGDPMIIQGESNDADSGVLLTGPADLSPIRVGAAAPDRLAMVSEDLYLRERRLVAALPSTREEFALFQAERSRERLMTVAASASEGMAAGGIVAGVATARGPEMRNSSSIAFTRDSASRVPLWQDLILQIRIPTDIAVLLRDNGFDPDIAERVKARMIAQLDIPEELPRGALLALRHRMQAGRREIMQLSLYDSGKYVGALAIGGAGQLVTAADPWADQPLLGQSVEESLDGERPQFRLLDVIYSAGLRNGVPGPVIGEAIALMAKVHDLDAFAAEGDRMQLLYATKPGPGADEAGRILYIGVTGPSGDKRCYVVPQKTGGYDCFAPGARVVVASGQPHLVAPVAGVLTVRFAPLAADGKGAEGEGMVVWQAAQGTPVVAVAAGRISAVEPAETEGGASLVIDHADGFTSRYRGLAELPPSVARGAEVKAGAVIGKIAAGNAKGGTGLGFAILKDGKAVDPVPLLAGGNEVLASNAVEMLISRIIHVESGGNAAAKNPLSTATGLGQFIEGTWLRMMRSYRPDLVATLDRRQLLDLRLEPALSRQMVRHLAQENEAFLRARGHQITAGNLYLAHFLGPMGASQVLSADPAASVGQVMGQGVVAANPFLTHYSVADLRNWAARKMDARAVGVAAALPETVEVKASPEVERFMAQMNEILADPKG